MSLRCAYPCSSVAFQLVAYQSHSIAFLGIAHPCLCISARLISLPGHASPFRFTAFQCNDYPTRRVHSHCRCHAEQFLAIPMHRPSTRRLSLAGPGFSTPFQSHSKRCFTIATHFSTTPLHHWAFLFHPVANLIWTMHFHYDASPSNAFPWLIGAFPCCSVASKTYAIHFRGCATPCPCVPVRGDSLLCHSVSRLNRAKLHSSIAFQGASRRLISTPSHRVSLLLNTSPSPF